MNAGVLAIIGSVITLAIAIFSEFFSAQARQREQDKLFDKRELEFEVLAQKALEKMRARVAEGAQGAQTVQDKLDQAMSDQGNNDAKP